MRFEDLALCEPILRSLAAADHHDATPIQQKAIPKVLKGTDLVACAQTGTGKTAAFAVPVLQRLLVSAAAPTGAARRRRRSGRKPVRALVLAPTRKLAAQIGASVAVYGKFLELRHTVLFGGVGQGPQVKALQAGVDVLVATPGRLLDLLGQGYVDLSAVEILILDEADRMLDMGFLPDLRRIISAVPVERQTLMFSATMPKEIRELARQWLRRPTEVRVAAAPAPDCISQTVYFVEQFRKAATLTQLLTTTDRSRTIIFSRTKRRADNIARNLRRDGIHAIAIHGDKSQAQRQAAMREFNSKQPPVLVATDLASRGLDFSDVSHVINFDLPDSPETYVHRIGRTARAGASGHAVTFSGSRDERPRLRMVERLTGRTVSVKELPTVSGSPQRDSGKNGPARKPSEEQQTPPAWSARPAARQSNGNGRRKATKANRGGSRRRAGNGR